MNKLLINENKIVVDNSGKVLTVFDDSVEINGLIEEYKVFAGETINAGDFVDFIVSKTKQSASESDSWGYYSILLEPNKVFISHRSNYSALSVTIVEINGTEMTSTTTKIGEDNDSYGGTWCRKINDNKIFIIHSPYYTSPSYLYGLYGTVVEVNGNTVNVISKHIFEENTDDVVTFDAVCLDENRTFLSIRYGDSDYLYGAVLEQNENEFSFTMTQLNSKSYSCYTKPSCLLLENNKVFIAHGMDSYYKYLGVTIVEINGTEMTATNKQITTYGVRANSAPSCVLLEPNKVFIAHGSDVNYYYLYGTIITIDGTTMKNYSHKLSSTQYSCRGCSCVLLEPNKVFIAHNHSNNRFLGQTVVVIDGTTINIESSNVKEDVYLFDVTPYCLLLEQNKIFITHTLTSSRYLSFSIYNGLGATANIKDMNGKINVKGIAKTSGTSGDTIQVYVPNNE
jgi:hypothetical protein